MEKEIKKPVKILFVCLGNICRSPAAEGVFKHMLRQRGITGRFEVDSAGTYGGHAGELPDPRMRSHAARRGYLLEHRSRPVRPDDFEKFDLILGLDDYNIDTLRSNYYISHKFSFRMLLLVQLITEVLQYVVTVTPVFFHFDKHFQKHLFSEETFDIFPGHST